MEEDKEEDSIETKKKKSSGMLKEKIKEENDNKKVQKIKSNAPQDKKNMKKDDIDSKSVGNVKKPSDKKTNKEDTVVNQVNKIAGQVDSTESSSQEPELMKQINAADLKQKLNKTKILIL